MVVHLVKGYSCSFDQRVRKGDNLSMLLGLIKKDKLYGLMLSLGGQILVNALDKHMPVASFFPRTVRLSSFAASACHM